MTGQRFARAANSRGLQAADRGVDGTNAQRSAGASRSSPAAAQRCAEGAGLDGDAPDRSTIGRAVHHSGLETAESPRSPSFGRLSYAANLHQLDGRDRAASQNQAKYFADQSIT